jgi:hypothetical protein
VIPFRSDSYNKLTEKSEPQGSGEESHRNPIGVAIAGEGSSSESRQGGNERFPVEKTAQTKATHSRSATSSLCWCRAKASPGGARFCQLYKTLDPPVNSMF